MERKRFLLVALALVLFSWATGTPERPSQGLVYDENRLMSAQQVEYFDKVSEELFAKTGSTLAVALLDDIGKRDIHEYAFEIAEKWGIDCKDGRGIMILVALKQRRQVVEIGSGNSAARQSIDSLQQKVLIPAFRKEHYGDGILALAFGLAQAQAREKGIALEIAPPPSTEDTPMSLSGWIFIIVVFGLLIAFGGKARRFGFVDNMKKLLSVSEIEKSCWPENFRNAFGDNLISAFLHGKCLMEGFDALESPWTVSFILKDNSPEAVAKLQPFLKRASRENISFCKFYSPAEIIRTLDTTPLEYLHIANRNVPLCGIKPLDGFRPHEAPLRKECANKLREIRERLQNEPRSEKVFNEAIPAIYGVYYLETGDYPEGVAQIHERFPELKGNDFAGAISALLRRADPPV